MRGSPKPRIFPFHENFPDPHICHCCSTAMSTSSKWPATSMATVRYGPSLIFMWKPEPMERLGVEMSTSSEVRRRRRRQHVAHFRNGALRHRVKLRNRHAHHHRRRDELRRVFAHIIDDVAAQLLRETDDDGDAKPLDILLSHVERRTRRRLESHLRQHGFDRAHKRIH